MVLEIKHLTQYAELAAIHHILYVHAELPEQSVNTWSTSDPTVNNLSKKSSHELQEEQEPGINVCQSYWMLLVMN